MNNTFFSVTAVTLSVLLALLPLALILMIRFHLKKKSVIQKVRRLSTLEKAQLLNTLAEPVGYSYDPYQDIFATRLDAPQKNFGYMHLYDLSAPYLNMVFDYETIYFDYNNRTWLLEFWKGQYGINSGCELGIYYADEVVSPDAYRTTYFHAVEPKDMLDISLWLNKRSTLTGKQHLSVSPSRSHIPSHTLFEQPSRLGRMRSRHWWLTIFKMGSFSKPQELFVNTSIRFKDYTMLSRFLDSFRKTLPDTTCKVNGLTVYFTFYHSVRKYSLFKKAVRRIALFYCKIYCKLFNYITRPFEQYGDRLLYLYYYLPFAVRLLFKPKKQKKARCEQSQTNSKCKKKQKAAKCQMKETK